ncbi:kinase-like domain-containing protein [Scleroderma yunnanense]
MPEQTNTVFQDLLIGTSDEACRTTVRTAEKAFTRLEVEVERILADLVCKLRASPNAQSLARQEISISKRSHDQLLRYFIFLRYRNGEQYQATVDRLTRRTDTGHHVNLNACHALHCVRRRVVSSKYHTFLHHESSNMQTKRPFKDFDCWKFCQAEICLGVAAQGCQYVLPDTCFTSLDEEFGTNSWVSLLSSSAHLLFPVMPTVALCILGTQDTSSCITNAPTARNDKGATWIDVGLESISDVHLRNASLLQCNPSHLYFSSLDSVVQTISSYDEFRWVSEHLNYSRLKQRARQKSILEKVTKTLLVKGSVLLVDLTGEVTKVGLDPVYHGGFSDVWKGVWTNSTGQSRLVALKFLRQYHSVGEDVQEKVLKRLKTEVIAWHRLQHPNILPLYGVIQSVNSIAMVSPWCNNGTIMQYLQRRDVQPDRMALLSQVASGVSYLHNMKPVVIHGDLRGTNILISDGGDALITDFGLSSVLDELSLESRLRAAKLGTSLLAGSTRWMAPELILTIVEDDDVVPAITTASDVYSFACVCLEVATGQLPYPHRRDDRAVTIDIMRGIKPSRGVSAACQIPFTDIQKGTFWDILNWCWESIPSLRPNMTEVKESLVGLKVPLHTFTTNHGNDYKG